MNIDALHEKYIKKLDVIMQTRYDELSELQNFLVDNRKIFVENTETNNLVQIFTIVVFSVFGVIFAYGVFNLGSISFLVGLACAVLGFFVSLLFKSFYTYYVNIFILFLKELKSNDWELYYMDSYSLWNKLSQKYPFLSLGDIDNSIHLCVEGKYIDFNFTYFEYDYTIEIEEEVEYEDNDGNTYYETEYYEESYTNTCIAIDINNTLPNITIDSFNAQLNALKFSYIDLNKAMSIYSNDTNQAYTFFDPQTQRLFVEFYLKFPHSKISIDTSRIFINFSEDLTNLARTVKFDEHLSTLMGSKKLTQSIKSILDSTIPIANNISSYKLKTN